MSQQSRLDKSIRGVFCFPGVFKSENFVEVATAL